MIPVSDAARKAIRELGLPEYESKAYLALIEAGRMDARDVSEATGIPYSKVYSVLRSLARRGWIEEKGGRPSIYFPKAPSEVLRTERVKIESRMRSYERALLDELQPIYEKRGIKERPDIWIIRGEVNILAKIREVLDRTREELMVALPALSGRMGEALDAILPGLKDRRVRISFLMGEDARGKLVQELVSGAEIRARRGMFGGGVIADSREAILLLGKGSGSEPMIAVWSDHSELTHIAKVYFEHLWKSAKG
ncbi:MAG: TrmB family transcriptional regulator [Candidatus Bathyarchaeia archaeon]